MKFEKQLEIFNELGYHFNDGVTPEFIFNSLKKNSWESSDPQKQFEDQPFSLLYYYFGWRDPDVPAYNFSEHCIWFDLEYFDPSSQYKWFMERMGVITNGELNFSNIEISNDENGFLIISFQVNGIPKEWKLEKPGYISDSYVQRFSYLPLELKTKGKYTYYSDGGQQFVIDYSTDYEQKRFIEKTSLKREWLGEGNHFSEPKDE